MQIKKTLKMRRTMKTYTHIFDL